MSSQLRVLQEASVDLEETGLAQQHGPKEACESWVAHASRGKANRGREETSPPVSTLAPLDEVIDPPSGFATKLAVLGPKSVKPSRTSG